MRRSRRIVVDVVVVLFLCLLGVFTLGSFVTFGGAPAAAGGAVIWVVVAGYWCSWVRQRGRDRRAATR